MSEVDTHSIEEDMREGIKLCEQLWGQGILMQVDPQSVDMSEGPGGPNCLMNQCERVRASGSIKKTEKTFPSEIDPAADFATKVCRGLLIDYQNERR